MKSLYLYFKFLFSDDEKLIAQWEQLSEERGSKTHREAIAKELQKRDYHYDGAHWTKSSSRNADSDNSKQTAQEKHLKGTYTGRQAGN